jgi:outer membrane protein assembly factor BamD (BamD/ComL family)
MSLARPAITSVRTLPLRRLWSVMCAFLLAAQTPEERIAFDAALRAFEGGLWERAANEFDEFAGKYPKSELKAETEQRRLYAQAEIDLARGAFQDAQRNFATYQAAHPANPRAVLAAVREAEAALRMSKPDIAIIPLGQTNLPFAKALVAGGPASVLFRGLLVRSEVLSLKQDLAAAEASLLDAEKHANTADEQWVRWRRLVLLRQSADKAQAAGEAATAFLSLANGDASLVERRAETASMVGQLRLKLGDAKGASEAFSKNLAAGTASEYVREATLRLAELDLAAGNFLSARQRLEAFLGAQPNDPEINSLRLRLGQGLFRQYLQQGTDSESSTLLSLAAQSFQTALTNAPTPELAGPLSLGLGWCQWEAGVRAGNAERVREAETSFLAASRLLKRDVDQAVAQFKAGDCLAFRREWARAATNYLAAGRDYADIPGTATLIEPALAQAVIAATEAGDLASAQLAAAKLVALNARLEALTTSTLLVGQALSLRGQSLDAVAILEGFLTRFPDAPLNAEIKLALVSTRLRSGDWTNAVGELDRWIAIHTNHPSLPRAEVDRWWAATQAGLVTNAIEQVQQLAARYPTNASVLTAQLALAADFFTQGDFARAEQTCLSIVTNSVWKGSEGWHRAKLRAAESARRRQAWANASTNIFELLNDPALPSPLLPTAFFELGELHLDRPPDPTAAPLANFRNALEAFTRAGQFTNSSLAPVAIGKMADCHLQLATVSTNSYEVAAELYRRAAEWSGADVAVRCKATVGRGMVAEKVAGLRGNGEAEALLRLALNHYLDVSHGKLLRPGERADGWWLKEAGREAGRLLEQMSRWTEAAALYEQLARELPALRAVWEDKAAKARQRQSAG